MMATATSSVEIDEELWFGSPGEDSELEERAAHSMAATAARVLGAKPFPAAARKLEEVTRGGGAKIEQVVAVLESDPGLSMRLLRLVNSAGYALRVRCTSVRHAAALVGMRRLHQLATTAAVLDLFENDRPLVKSLLNHAAAVGAVCRYLAVHVDLSPDELFTCGFLHDIGKLMLIDAEGQSYMDLVREAGETPEALHLLERQKYGFDHAVLGAHVLKSWQIPNPVPRVVAWHHSVGRAYQSDTQTAAMVQTLRLADFLSYVLRSNPDAEGVRLASETDSARYLGISEAQLSAMWPDLTRLSQRIHSTPAANGSDIIPREDSIPPSMRDKGSLRPSHRFGFGPGTSLSPSASLSMPGPAALTASEVPNAFTCVVCKRASHGTRCPVCSGHVCSEHQVGPEQWCSDCANVYKLDVQAGKTPNWVRYSALGIVLGAATVSLLVAVLAGSSLAGAMLGSTLLSSVAVGALVVGRSVWLKRNFIRRRGQAVDPESVAEPSLPFGLTMQPEPEIAVRPEGDSLSPPSELNPRWTRSELPRALSIPASVEPFRAGPHAHPDIAPSVFPQPEAAPDSVPPPAPEPRRQTRTDPVPAVLSARAPARVVSAPPSSEGLPAVLSAPAVAPPQPAAPAVVVAPPTPARDLVHVPAAEPFAPTPTFRPAPERQAREDWSQVSAEAGFSPVERTRPNLDRSSVATPSARPAPAAPLLEQSVSQAPQTNGSVAPQSEAARAACAPIAKALLVPCRIASLQPVSYACSSPEQR